MRNQCPNWRGSVSVVEVLIASKEYHNYSVHVVELPKFTANVIVYKCTKQPVLCIVP